MHGTYSRAAKPFPPLVRSEAANNSLLRCKIIFGIEWFSNVFMFQLVEFVKTNWPGRSAPDSLIDPTEAICDDLQCDGCFAYNKSAINWHTPKVPFD
jgi:hypothetical protein